MFRLAGNLVSPAGGRGRLVVLIYHRVLPQPDPLLHDVIDSAGFERHMALLAADFNVLPLGEACERLARERLPARAAAITFDDGYADNEEIALPILRRFGLVATFFVATGYSHGRVMFNDVIIEALRSAPAGRHDLSRLGLGSIELTDICSRRATVDSLIVSLMHRVPPEREALVGALAAELGLTRLPHLMMTPAQIAQLHRAGMEIGAHTVNHPILACIDDEAARSEIVESRRTLEEITGAPVTVFAYPNGRPGRDYTARHVQLVKEAGFRAAVSTTRGIAHRGSSLYELPRFGPWDRDPRRLGLRLLLGCAQARPRPHAEARTS
jgi:peptidoglycan/xylan/chitin deacetylase (PgdA/CDA1 family)